MAHESMTHDSWFLHLAHEPDQWTNDLTHLAPALFDETVQMMIILANKPREIVHTLVVFSRFKQNNPENYAHLPFFTI